MEVVSHDFGMDANVMADFIAEQGVVRDFTFVNEDWIVYIDNNGHPSSPLFSYLHQNS